MWLFGFAGFRRAGSQLAIRAADEQELSGPSEDLRLEIDQSINQPGWLALLLSAFLSDISAT